MASTTGDMHLVVSHSIASGRIGIKDWRHALEGKTGIEDCRHAFDSRQIDFEGWRHAMARRAFEHQRDGDMCFSVNHSTAYGQIGIEGWRDTFERQP